MGNLFRKLRIKLAFITFALMALIISCEEDFDVNADYQDITIIYGLVDPGEDSIFLKINKAFLGDGNALVMAEIEDSSIYVSGLEAVIEEWDGNSLLRSYELDTITIGNKEDGIFFNPYQIIYYTPYEPQPSRNYRLRVNVNGKTVTSETNLVNEFSVSKPSAGSKFIQFRPDTKGSVEWTSAKNGKRYEVVIRMKYKEVLFDSPDTVYTYADWGMGTRKSISDKGGEEMKIEYSNDGFYTFIGDQIPYSDPAREANVKERYTNDVDFIFAVAAEEFNTYMEVNEPSSSIIQERPDYTNISNGIGLFSSRYRTIRTKKIHPETIVEIQTQLPELKFIF